MSRLKEALAAELAKKVSQHGLVIWQDSAAEYEPIAAEIAPAKALFARYEGSWYGLRREVESHLAGDEPPRLLVYVPTKAPDDDPLLEVRKAGHEFVRRLPTLVREALKGELSEPRISELCQQARTLSDVEAALIGGEGADLRLIRVLETTEPRTMALRLFAGERDDHIEAEDAWKVAAEFLSEQFGGEFSGSGHALRAAAIRQLILTEIEGAAGLLPDSLRPAWAPTTVEQRRRTTDLLTLWRADPARRRSYAQLATEADTALNFPERLEWREGLAASVSSPGVETVAYRHALALLDEEAWDPAVDLARARQDSPWCRPDMGDETWAARANRWRSVETIAELRRALNSVAPPSGAATGDLLTWYVRVGWEVDQAHRRYEMARLQLDAYGDLEVHITRARSAYEAWLDATLLAASAAIESHGVDPGSLPRQGEIHDRWVRNADGPIAYVWVDALRYELGRELAEHLSGVAGTVQIHAAVAAAPTITPVGMANLGPDAASRLSLAVEGSKLSVRINGTTIATVPDRVDLLRAVHGDRVVDRQLDAVAAQGERDLRRSFKGAHVVLVRSQELDMMGESGMLQAAWPQFAEVVQMLAKVVARLGHAGVRRVVISADHGFVALPRNLGPDRAIDSPKGGVGELHRRAWIGHGAVTAPSTIRVSLAATGTPGDADLIVPRGLAVFRGGGSKQFFHGGLSPQELIVPVVVIDFAEAVAAPKLKVGVAVAGERLTTGMFAATLSFEGDLFTGEIKVRAVAQGPEPGSIVARVVSGDGFDPGTGVITLRRGIDPVLAFQVTENLERGNVIRVEVLDAATGVVLGTSDVHVAARILVEEDLG